MKYLKNNMDVCFRIPVESVKNANNAVETDDTVNSNKTWQQSGMIV